MKKIFFASIVLLMSGIFDCHCYGFGELTYLPSYYFRTKKLDWTRVALFVEENLSESLFYTSWTGIGRFFPLSPNVNDVTWYTTQQDIGVRVGDRLKLGGGLGVSYSHPENNTDVDLHFRFALKLWP